MMFKKSDNTHSRTTHSEATTPFSQKMLSPDSLALSAACESHNYQGNFVMLLYFHLSSRTRRRVFHLQSRGLTAACYCSLAAPHLACSTTQIVHAIFEGHRSPLQEPRARSEKKSPVNLWGICCELPNS